MEFRVIGISRHRMKTDGAGVTSLVALQGCPLRCKYCINMDALGSGKFKRLTTNELVEQVMQDYCYYLATGGGVTFGGGESLMWGSQILEFRDLLPRQVAVNVETSLNVPFKKLDADRDLLDELLDKLDLFILDIKTLDDQIYKDYTGVDCNYRKRNIQKIVDKGLQNKCKIRIPVIPDFTTMEDAKRDELTMREKGFENIEIFEYIIR